MGGNEDKIPIRKIYKYREKLNSSKLKASDTLETFMRNFNI